MAGVPAGRLSIEIVAEIARLQQDLDKAKRAVGAASKDMAGSAKYANDNIAKMGPTSKLAGHHLSNLSFQLQDVVVGLQSGQKPMTVFLQQGGQIAQIMGQAGIGVGGLVKQVGMMALNFARAHPIILGITAALGVGALAFKRFTGQIEESGELQKFVDGLGLSKDELEELGPVTITAGDAIKGLWKTIDEGLGLSGIFSSIGKWASEAFSTMLTWGKNAAAGVYAAFVGTYNGLKVVWSMLPAAFGDAVYSAANAVIDGLNWLIRQATTLLNLHIIALNALPFTDIALVTAPQIEKLTNQYAGAGAKAGQAFIGAYRDAYDDALAGMDRFGTRLANNIVDAAKDRIGARADEIIDDRTAEKVGRKAGKKIGEAAAMSFREAFRDVADYLDRILDAGRDTAKMRETLEQLEREATLLGVTGHERERRLLQMEYEAEIADLLAKIKVAEIQGEQQLVEEYRRQLELLGKIYDLKTGAIDFAEKVEKDAKAAEELNDRLRETIDLLHRMGGAGSVLGGLISILSGDFSPSALGGGKLGALLSAILETKDEDGKKLGKVIAEELDKIFKDVFGPKGLFGKTLTQVLESAGRGMAWGRVIAGDQGTGGDIGGAIGGVIGSAIGTAIGGPIGGMIGEAVLGTIGSLVGGLFSSSKGSVTLNGTGITGTRYSNSGAIANSTKAAGGIIDTLADIAARLGGTLNAVSGVSIGQRKGDWYLDPTGKGRVKGSGVIGFGEDAEAAAMAAVQLLIQRGVIGGIRASTQNILRAGGDLQAALDKALRWEEVMREAEAAASPFTAALSDLKREFDDIAVLAREARASTAELAKIQELLVLRQKQLIDQAMASYRSTFLSDAEQLAAARQTISSTLSPLGFGDVDTVAEYKALVEATDALANPDLFGALMDLADEFATLKEAAEKAEESARAAAEAEKLLAQQRAALEIQILQAQGRDAEALAKQRAMELAAADESLRALLQALYKAQDIAGARNDLATAYDRESRALQQTIEHMGSLGETLREVRASIYGTENATGNYARTLANLRRIGGMAAMGDEKAMGQLGGAINDFLPAALANARTLQDYQRAQALAARYADSAISAADMAVTLASQQLDEMKAQVGQLIDLNETVLSVDQAMAQLVALQGGSIPAGATPAPGGGSQEQEREDRLNERMDRAEEHRRERWDRQQRRDERMLATLDRLEQLWNRLSPDGLALTIRTDDDTPIVTVPAP